MARRVVDLDPLEVRWEHYVQPLYQTLHSGGIGLDGVPRRLKEIIRSEAWRQFIPPGHETRRYDDFASFVTTPPTAGLGSSIDRLQRLVADDREAADLLDQALKRPRGGNHTKHNNVKVAAPVGNRADAALRRLRKDRPDLHRRVLAGELTPNAAMVEAGFRHRTVSVRIDDIDAMAATLRRHVAYEDLCELRDRLP